MHISKYKECSRNCFLLCMLHAYICLLIGKVILLYLQAGNSELPAIEMSLYKKVNCQVTWQLPLPSNCQVSMQNFWKSESELKNLASGNSLCQLTFFFFLNCFVSAFEEYCKHPSHFEADASCRGSMFKRSKEQIEVDQALEGIYFLFISNRVLDMSRT